jgi:Icc-related predicted phosphoesterase
VGRASATPEETLDIGGKQYVRKGSTVSLQGTDADDEYVVGQITDIKDHNPQNAQNIKEILAWFKTEKVDAIAVTGDLGESEESVEAVLRDISAAGVPVLAIIGNRECREDFNKAVVAVQKEHKNVINMDLVRVFNTDDLSIVSMPGYYNKNYLHCQEGCEYTPADAKELPKLAESATGPVKMLISHGPPQQSGPSALDRIHEGANVGDPALAEVMKSGLFPFGLFGNIEEAGGYGTDLTGTQRVPQETFANALYVNSGPADGVRWVMLDNSESYGMAGVMKVKGKQAMYKVLRLKNPDAKGAAAPKAPAKDASKK